MTSPEDVVAFNLYDEDLGVKINTNPLPAADFPYTYPGLTPHSLHHLSATAINAAGLESARSTVLPLETDSNPVRGQPLIPETQASIDTIVQAALNPAAFIYGAIIGITTPDGDYYQAYGSDGGSTTLTTDYRMRFGSCTKMYTATLILAQVDAGHISLDDTLGMYVSGVANGDIITIQQLLQMQSGIEDYLQQDATVNQAYFLTPQNTFDPLPHILSYAPIFAPGTQTDYSNSNYFLLGMILEWCDATYGTGRDIRTIILEDCLGALVLTETEWPTGNYMTPLYSRGWTANLALPTILAQIAAEEAAIAGIFGPFGPLFGPLIDSIVNAVAPSYFPPGASLNPFVEFTAVSTSWGDSAGALDGTVRDLVKFGEAIASGALLSPEMQQRRLETFVTYLTYTPNSYNGPGWMGMGLGVIQWGSWLGWVGNLGGYITVMFANPVNGSVIAVMMNSMQATSLDVFYQIAHLLYPELTLIETQTVRLDGVAKTRTFGPMQVVRWGAPGASFPYTFPITLS